MQRLIYNTSRYGNKIINHSAVNQGTWILCFKENPKQLERIWPQVKQLTESNKLGISASFTHMPSSQIEIDSTVEEAESVAKNIRSNINHPKPIHFVDSKQKTLLTHVYSPVKTEQKKTESTEVAVLWFCLGSFATAFSVILVMGV